ncbi:hypothetical protein Tco_1175524 [Tanacetum coccineum]
MKLRRARAMSMTIHTSNKARMLEAQSEASKGIHTLAKMLKGLDKKFKRKEDGGLYLAEPIWVPVYGNLRALIMNEAHAISYVNGSYKYKAQAFGQSTRSPEELLMPTIELAAVEFRVLYVGPFEIVERVGPVAYQLRLPQELVGIHDTFHMSNLKKCLADVTLHILFEEVKINDKLHFVEEPMEIMDREVKKLKKRWIPIVKIRWNSR